MAAVLKAKAEKAAEQAALAAAAGVNQEANGTGVTHSQIKTSTLEHGDVDSWQVKK